MLSLLFTGLKCLTASSRFRLYLLSSSSQVNKQPNQHYQAGGCRTRNTEKGIEKSSLDLAEANSVTHYANI